ncbi:MAG: copper homeostasis protein CutC [Erysipelotrichaceae bacterium]|nr:copper homeostasis protein CutC [Erysipelotrichaceae bacterium]
MIVEICCGSYEDCLTAQAVGASRVELNSALFLGGLTPSLASLQLTKQHTPLKVICMLRPRGAGFCYSDDEFSVMLADCRLLMEHGADGISFGILTEDGKVDVTRSRQIVELVKSYGADKEVVFHRAFDCVDDAEESILALIDMGIDRVLTSGLQASAIRGMEVIRFLQEHYGNQIEILAGSGINETNVAKLIQDTKISQVHSSCKGWKEDLTTCRKAVSYSYHDQNSYDVVDATKAKALIEAVKQIQNV